MIDIPQPLQQIQETYPTLETPLYIELPKCTYAVSTNSHELMQHLSVYFRQLIVPQAQADAQITAIQAIECPAPQLELIWQDWRRDQGKIGRKDTYVDLEGSRIIRKARTGMVFMQSEELRLAAGPCLKNASQVINFIINQYMTLLQNEDYLICHAAACASERGGVAIAGFSGGGKSTSMLHIMDEARCNFVSNDRLFMKRTESGVQASGVPKLPRVNPGTLIHNKRLRRILKEGEIQTFESMPQKELWQLEQKFDVDIEDVYGEQRMQSEVQLNAVIILNWNLDDDQDCQILPFQASERADLLQALMKSPGPFYQQQDGHFRQDGGSLNSDTYVEMLGDLPLYEAVGRVDFAILKQFCLEHLL